MFRQPYTIEYRLFTYGERALSNNCFFNSSPKFVDFRFVLRDVFKIIFYQKTINVFQ